MSWRTSDYIIFVGSIALIALVLFLVTEIGPTASSLVARAVGNASVAARFRPTYFEVYDKSSDTVCDRLVLVKPFEWTVWAKSGRVYLINDTNCDCPLNTTPAVVVPHQLPNDAAAKYLFTSVCIDVHLQSLLDGYRDVRPHRVAFEIQDLQAERDKFTILDVLNHLFKRYLTMEPPVVGSGHAVDVINENPVNGGGRSDATATTRVSTMARKVFSKKEKERLLEILGRAM